MSPPASTNDAHPVVKAPKGPETASSIAYNCRRSQARLQTPISAGSHSSDGPRSKSRWTGQGINCEWHLQPPQLHCHRLPQRSLDKLSKESHTYAPVDRKNAAASDGHMQPDSEMKSVGSTACCCKHYRTERTYRGTSLYLACWHTQRPLHMSRDDALVRLNDLQIIPLFTCTTRPLSVRCLRYR